MSQRITKYLIITVISTITLAKGSDFSDEAIRKSLQKSTGYFDTPGASARCVQSAFICCGYDTNRFARLICEVSQSNRTPVSECMVELLGLYGTPTQLPYLYSLETNTTVKLNTED